MATHTRQKGWRSAGYTVAVLAAFAAWLFIADSLSVPPQSKTYGAMYMAKRRSLRFAHAHDRFPSLTENLPKLEGYSNSIVDGWGRDLSVKIEGDVVTYISYGRDGRPGGNGQDADIIGSFRMKQSDGSWSEENCAWIVNPKPVSD